MSHKRKRQGADLETTETVKRARRLAWQPYTGYEGVAIVVKEATDLLGDLVHVVLQLADLIYPVVGEHDTVTVTTLRFHWPNGTRVALVPGFNAGDFMLCSLAVLDQHTIPLLDWCSRGRLDYISHSVCADDDEDAGHFAYWRTSLFAVGIGIVSLDPLPAKVLQQLASVATYAPVLEQGCTPDVWPVPIVTTQTYGARDLQLQLDRHVLPLVGLYRGEWFDRTRFWLTHDGTCQADTATWFWKSRAAKDAVHRRLDRLASSALGSLVTASHATIWNTGFGWKD